jgi:hypothetical protein
MFRFRPRISLLSSLLLMTVVGLAIIVAQLWSEVGPLRSELRRLRDEVGALSIDDPTKPCAIAVRTTDDFTWKWRLFIPDGRSYKLKYSGERIPKDGIPQAHGTISLSDAGETWIEYRIKSDPQSGIWTDTLRTPFAGVGSSRQEWVTWDRRTSSSPGVGYTTQTFELGKLIVLARHRVSQKAGDSSKIENPSAGFMIWLEPVN